MDAKDILGIPKNGNIHHPAEKKSKPPKEHHRKPDGISREVYMLTGGVAPLMPAIDTSQLKKRPPSDEKVTWQWLSFKNSARKDDLELYHWVRVVNGVPPTGDYPFAKYNKSVDVIRYTDEEYEKYLTNPKWTKEETDTLFDLCERFDLRFVVIADRFPSPRTMEELKDRYYCVSRTILIARAPTPAEVSGHPLVKEPYNAQQETERKRALSMVLSQSKHQERKDAEVLAEAKRIHELRMLSKSAEDDKPSAKDVAAEHTDLAPDEVSPSASAAAIAAVDTTTIPASVRMLQVYLRSYALDKMVEAANSTAGPRSIKRVEEALQDLGVNLKPKVPTKAVCAEHLELRKEILTLLNLQKQLQYKAADGSSYRDGAYADTPGTPKRRVGDQDRPFIPDALNFGGDRVGKKDQKRKGPGRPPDAPSSPATKRARKFKVDG
ncbi:SWR1-complex protein 4 [Silene latifolia]|uniref:SWR1-complex protein 4 n=1 Tax=Silene latifolia TaxID=37657 RepID=UPI003D782345